MDFQMKSFHSSVWAVHQGLCSLSHTRPAKSVVSCQRTPPARWPSLSRSSYTGSHRPTSSKRRSSSARCTCHRLCSQTLLCSISQTPPKAPSSHAGCSPSNCGAFQMSPETRPALILRSSCLLWLLVACECCNDLQCLELLEYHFYHGLAS